MIKVLIVEDDPMVSQLNKKYVETVKGFKVVYMAGNGQEALNFLKNHSVDLIILDVFMPKLDGISLLKEVRRRSIKTDVILVTAAKESENIDEVLRLGAVDYLIKPFEYQRLKSTLDSYIERHQLLNHKNTIFQKDIDKIMKQNADLLEKDYQKGIHKKTLERIRRFMKHNEEKYLTSEEVAEKMEVSRVTVRRYLEYLVSLEELILEIEYGSIGRPKHLYKYKK
ncbi:two-component system, CitB family, response regulator/two-component system, CitB family, response regulator DctR [Anaerovirgula multivorans]|uniref:Transcriptional regulatory protein n=1 Tax=Anaerovirgula multivorans TaxID=312168 RepID=A0A239H0B2_9FIRM|nr:response regulator [Anaerovirgula multivorans]SNS74827.1 two-component system, CitB family, response regulator/two-component system, CitB family, response regulator DctR [Anaerovirgula multivorans]